MTRTLTVHIPMFDSNDQEFEVEVQVSYYPGSPGRMYMANGDPGDPPESEEIEVLSSFRTDTGEDFEVDVDTYWDTLMDGIQNILEGERDAEAEARYEDYRERRLCGDW